MCFSINKKKQSKIDMMYVTHAFTNIRDLCTYTKSKRKIVSCLQLIVHPFKKSDTSAPITSATKKYNKSRTTTTNTTGAGITTTTTTTATKKQKLQHQRQRQYDIHVPSTLRAEDGDKDIFIGYLKSINSIVS